MSDHEAAPVRRLDQHLRAARRRAFVGRAAEIAMFRSALAGDAESFAVLHLHGPGGIGKTALLHRFAEEAQAAQRSVTFVDHRYGDSIDAFLVAAEPAVHAARPVLIVDSLEGWGFTEHWLRDTFLPVMPSGAVVVLAGRRPPGVEWTSDPGWSGVLRPLTVPALPPADVAALLEPYDLPPAVRDETVAFGGGNPLALHVAAQAGMTERGGARDRSVTRILLDRFVGDFPSALHRRALEVCALARTTDEDLLRAALPDVDSAVLFDWLRRLSFIEVDPRGVYPTDVVRRVLDTELRWRSPETYGDTHARVKADLLRRLKAASDDGVVQAMADLKFVAGPRTLALSGTSRDGKLQDHPCLPGDRETIKAVALAVEGRESTDLVAFWLDRRPESFRVLRRPGSDRVVAFYAWLGGGTLTEEELSTDPLLAAAWADKRRDTPAGCETHWGIMRFAVSAESDRHASPATDLMRLRFVAEMVRDERLTQAYVVTPHPGAWTPLLQRYERSTALGAVAVGSRDHTLLMIRAQQPPADEPTADPGPAADPGPGPTMPREAFDAAVRDALRSLRRPDQLVDNPLVHSRLVTRNGDVPPVQALRDALHTALEALGADPRQAKLHRALTATFVRGAQTQQLAADRLGLPFSTYRRHLTRGLDAICDLLWTSEQHDIDLLGPQRTGT